MAEHHVHHPHPYEGENATDQLPHVNPSTENGHWEIHNPESPVLTPASRIRVARVALALTDKYPDGWHLKVLKETKRDRYGRIEYFVPDRKETEE